MRWLFVLALISCGSKDSGPSCEQVIEHMLGVTKEALAGHDNVRIDGQKTAMIEQCHKREMPLEQRKCIMGAKTLREISICRGGKPSAADRKPRDKMEGVKPGSAATGTGIGTGSGSAPGSAK